MKSIQETTRGYQEVFSYKPLRQRSKTAIFQEHLMQFRPCAQMTFISQKQRSQVDAILGDIAAKQMKTRILVALRII